jgi:hypothetical protein
MVKAQLIILTLALLFSCEAEKPTEIIVIGAIHNPQENFNPDILFKILDDVKPDYILRELDSAAFTPDFHHKNVVNSNEGMASEKYVEAYPAAQLRPYDFEGRNEHRVNIGSRPTDGLTTKLLDSLNKVQLLTAEEASILNTYNALLEPLIVAASMSPENFNNTKNDSLCAKRQHYQYTMLQKITSVREEFANHVHTKPNGEKISYRDGYKLAADFWDLRNQTMAKNIMKISEQAQGKRIVVLCGFMHRYYILSELKRLTKGKNIVLKEYYD